MEPQDQDEGARVHPETLKQEEAEFVAAVGSEGKVHIHEILMFFVHPLEEMTCLCLMLLD